MGDRGRLGRGLFGQSWDLLHRWVGRGGLFAVGAIAAVALVGLGRRYGSRLLVEAERWVPAALTLREVILVGANLAAVGLCEDHRGRGDPGIHRVDRVVGLALHQWAAPPLDRIMQAFSTIGSAAVVLPIVGLVLAWAVKRKDRRATAVLTAVTAVTEGVNAVPKWAFQRVRPSLWAVGTLHSYSFPSGHAMAAVASTA